MEFRIYHVTRYQCPLGLVLHFYTDITYIVRDMNNVYQCPFGLGLHFYIENYLQRNKKRLSVSMPFLAKAPFLRYPFENIGFMRFLEPVFAGIYQNILAMTIFVHVNNLDIFNCHQHYLDLFQYNTLPAVCHPLFLHFSNN